MKYPKTNFFIPAIKKKAVRTLSDSPFSLSELKEAESSISSVLMRKKDMLPDYGSVVLPYIIDREGPAIEESSSGKLFIFKAITDQMLDLYARKNEDYGDSFGIGFKEHGDTMAVIRLEDKLRRLKSLVKTNSQQVKDESIEDTLMDLANYAVMTLIEHKLQKK